MYIGSFLKALFTPRKIWCSIYFLLNLVIVFFIFAAPELMAEAEAGHWVGMGFIGVAVSMFFTFVSLSPLGEAYVRFKERVKQLPRNEQTAWIYEMFDEVHAAARGVNAKISGKVKLYYKETEEINAYAVGHRTVIVTHGILRFSPEQIKGVLAHEFGHISGGDSGIRRESSGYWRRRSRCFSSRSMRHRVWWRRENCLNRCLRWISRSRFWWGRLSFCCMCSWEDIWRSAGRISSRDF